MMQIRRMRLRGSFTVEASVILPLVIFIMTGMLYVICCLHDRAIMQSCTLRTAEAALAGRQLENLGESMPAQDSSMQGHMIMSEASEPSAVTQTFSLMAIYRSMRSCRRFSAQSRSILRIMPQQTAALAGAQWESSCRAQVTVPDYPADYLRYQMKQKTH